MGEKSSKVSIVVPTHNEGSWLVRTIESINSTYAGNEYEIIVVDDCCTDGSTDGARHLENVRVIRKADVPSGCVVARNFGAAAADGEYICFIDSHILVVDDWLSRLVHTSKMFSDTALVSGNIYSSDRVGDPEVTNQQYAYTLKDWLTASHWHFHGNSTFTEPYRTPLCPAGLMLVHQDYFRKLGGFSERIKLWGGTDVEISLKNYFYGGTNVVNPDVWIYHYYKNTGSRKQTFRISYRETFFNRLLIAKIFTNFEVYRKTREVLSKKAPLDEIESELHSEENLEEILKIQMRFRRSWGQFCAEFKRELSECFTDSDPKTSE